MTESATGLALVNAEAQVRAAFGATATVLRHAYLNDHEILLSVKTRRKYGQWAVIICGFWQDRRMAGLYTGHYFDSLAEAIEDFNARNTSKRA